MAEIIAVSRRDFLKYGLAALAVSAVQPRRAFAQEGQPTNTDLVGNTGLSWDEMNQAGYTPDQVDGAYQESWQALGQSTGMTQEDYMRAVSEGEIRFLMFVPSETPMGKEIIDHVGRRASNGSRTADCHDPRLAKNLLDEIFGKENGPAALSSVFSKFDVYFSELFGGAYIIKGVLHQTGQVVMLFLNHYKGGGVNAGTVFSPKGGDFEVKGANPIPSQDLQGHYVGMNGRFSGSCNGTKEAQTQTVPVPVEDRVPEMNELAAFAPVPAIGVLGVALVWIISRRNRQMARGVA